MSTTSLTAVEVMNRAASLMNDTAREVYTYEAQLPYLNMAFDELQEIFELNNIPVTMKTSSPVIDIDVGVTEVTPVEDTANPPHYPEDLIEIEQIWERLQGSTDPYTPLTKRNYLPHYLADQPVDSLVVWSWNDQKILFLGATTDREIKLDYIKALFTEELTEDSTIGIINAKSFLQYRTAGLLAEFSGENPSRAASLNQNALLALDRSMGISIKASQAVVKRRRPFRSGFKQRGQVW